MKQTQKKYIIHQLVSNQKYPLYKIGDIILYQANIHKKYIEIDQFIVISAKAIMDISMEIKDTEQRETKWIYTIAKENNIIERYLTGIKEEDIISKV